MLHALSVDAELLIRFRPGMPIAVHSRFRRTTNLLIAGELVTLAARSVDDAPATIRLPGDTCPPLAARDRGRVVEASGDGPPRRALRWAGLTIDLGNATPWNLRPAAWTDAPLGIAELAATLARHREATTPESLGGPALGEVVSARTDAVLDALRFADRRGLDRTVRELVGLGIGLTPSGDDVLVGMAIVLAMPGGPAADDFGMLASAIRQHAVRTNDISRAALLQAANGRGRASVLELLAAVASDDPSAVWSAAAPVLAIGHSSGADIATGMLRALEHRQARAGRA